MNLSSEIISEIARLGGASSDCALDSISWPTGCFNWSHTRIRKVFSELSEIDEYEMEDYIHPLRDLKFVEPKKGFWSGWESDFSGTDSKRFIAFASDEAFFYFIDSKVYSKNPAIFYVDHETTDEEPYQPNDFNLYTLLAVLE